MHGIVNLIHVLLRSVCTAISYTTQDQRGMQNKNNPYLLITAQTLVYGSSIIRCHSLECVMYQYPGLRQQE